MRLFLIRHAQSANNALPEHRRVEDPPLTPVGQKQAAALAEWLVAAGLTRMVASPFRRSLETAEHIRLRLSVPAEIWVDLHEQGGCYSGYEPACYQGRPGMTREEILAHFPGYVIEDQIDHTGWWKCQPYESDELALTRARRLLDKTLQLFGDSDESLAYVMHADFKRILLTAMFSQSPAGINGAAATLYNTSVTELHLKNGRFEVAEFNSVAHLPTDLITC